MTYTSAEKSMSEEDFIEMTSRMYGRLSIRFATSMAKQWYHDFGLHPEDILIKACKRIGENDTKRITWRVIKDAISEVTPAVENGGAVGCEYCDPVGLIHYYKEINHNMYQFSARCHICRTSRYINEPFYNEIFPHDDIKPHSTPEQMKCGKHIVEDVVRLLTGREHADEGMERKRERQLYREKTL
jgi:hypothetical protein